MLHKYFKTMKRKSYYVPYKRTFRKFTRRPRRRYGESKRVVPYPRGGPSRFGMSGAALRKKITFKTTFALANTANADWQKYLFLNSFHGPAGDTGGAKQGTNYDSYKEMYTYYKCVSGKVVIKFIDSSQQNVTVCTYLSNSTTAETTAEDYLSMPSGKLTMVKEDRDSQITIVQPFVVSRIAGMSTVDKDFEGEMGSSSPDQGVYMHIGFFRSGAIALDALTYITIYQTGFLYGKKNDTD